MAFLPTQNESVDEILANAGTGKGPVLLPDGKYTAIIVETDMKSTKDGNGQFLYIKFVITQGQYRDTEFEERLNLVNNNQTAVKIAYESLARLAKALGYDKLPADSKDLHNKPVTLVLKTEAGKPYKDKEGVTREGKDRSTIYGYEPASGTPVSAGNANKLPWKR